MCVMFVSSATLTFLIAVLLTVALTTGACVALRICIVDIENCLAYTRFLYCRWPSILYNSIFYTDK